MNDQQERNTLPLVAMSSAFFGAMIGAIAVVLSDKDKRKKVSKVMTRAMDEGQKQLDTVQEKVKEKWQELTAEEEKPPN